MKKSRAHLTLKTKLVLGAMLLLAALFRFYNLNWDRGGLFHPDERNIANAVSHITLFSQMDPQFYAYGGFLIYLYKFTADILVFFLHNPSIAHDWGWINVIGRSYSAFFSTLTIIPLFLLGRKMFGEKVGFVSCLLYALTVASIQTAHYSTTENLLTLLILVITYLALLLYERPSIKLTLVAGAFLGIAVATKTTGLSYAILPGAALLLPLIKHRLSLQAAVLSGVLLGLTTLAVYTLFSPFTFLNWDKFMESMHYENSVVSGENRVVYTLQFSHTTPYLFQLKNLFWQMGPLALISWIGIGLTFWQEIKNKRILFLIFLSFPSLYFFYIGSWYTKFIRYMVLLLPFFILFASNFLVVLMKKYRLVGRILSGGVILITFLWAIAFMSIYTKEQTRIAASRWIYKNIPAESTLLSEHWDEGLPISLPEGNPSRYKEIPLTIYEPDNEAKIDYYAEYLSQADYVTINSRRLYGTLIHLPERYPVTKRYYELLFSGTLGYKKVAEFSSYPTLFGITINDDSSEETFQVYDHPKGIIFKKVKHYSFQELQELLKH